MTSEELLLHVLVTYDTLSEKPVLTPEESDLMEFCGQYIDALGLALAGQYAKLVDEGRAPLPQIGVH